MILFIRRSRREGSDPHLKLKVVLFVLGAIMAIAGMLLVWTWLVAAAMVVLGVGFIVRFLPGRGHTADEERAD